MENRDFFQKLTQYRVKVERDGKSVVDVPGLVCLPAMLMAPRISIAGIMAAPLLGYSVRLENDEGKTVHVEQVVQKTAETVADTAKKVKEELDKAWQSISADDPEEETPESDAPESGNPEAEAAESGKEETAEAEDITVQEPASNEAIVEELEKHANDDEAAPDVGENQENP